MRQGERDATCLSAPPAVRHPSRLPLSQPLLFLWLPRRPSPFFPCHRGAPATPIPLAMSGSKRARSQAGSSHAAHAAAPASAAAAAADGAELLLADVPVSALPAAPPKRPRPDSASAGSGAASAYAPSGEVSAHCAPPAGAAPALATALDGAPGATPPTLDGAAAASVPPAGATAPAVSGSCLEGGSTPAGGTLDGDALVASATAPPAAVGEAAADASAASTAVIIGAADTPGGAVKAPPPAGEDGGEVLPADPAAGAGGVAAPPPAADTTPEERVRSTIKALLNRWAAELAALPESDRRTYKVRAEYATCEQTVDHLRPLLRQLRKRTVARNILRALEEIFDHVAAREYVRANDRYLRLAIGNAPWPMGATMVGIHARSAREKIGEGKVAHVMNDEETRKYITAIKRLVTLAQKYHPTVPSKMMSS